LKSLINFKSSISQEVYQSQISSISLEKSIEKSPSLNLSGKSSEVPRKVGFNNNNDINFNSVKAQELSPDYFDHQLLEFIDIKSDIAKNVYRKSLINERTISKKERPNSTIERPMSSRLSYLSGFMKENSENLKKASISLKAYKEIIETLEKHLKDPQNALGFLLKEFTKQAIDLCREITGVSKDDKQIIKDLYDNFCIDTKTFLEILQETLCLFYNIEHLAEAFPDFVFFTKENLINFLFNLFFQTEIYEILLDIEDSISDDSEEKLRINLTSLEGFTIKDFSIPPGLINPKKEPFIEAIKIFRRMGHCRSPMQKMIVILKTSDSFIKEITEISQEILTGDDTLLILLYIVVKANIDKINGQLNLIERFAGKGLLMARSGYYFATIQICVKHLEEENMRDMMLKQEMIQSLKGASEAISWGKGNNNFC